MLCFFAWALTCTESGLAGRTYAAYDGICIDASMIWIQLVEGNRPDRGELTGSAIGLIGRRGLAAAVWIPD